MVNFTNEQIIEIFKMMGLNSPVFLDGKNIVNLYKLLNIVPQKNEDGSRILTPYEHLGVLPVFKDGKEVPIVFAIKNKVSKIGKYEGEVTKFIYKTSKVKEQQSTIDKWKEKYRAAVLAGDESQAESCLSMIDSLTGGKASDYVDSFYNYAKFYKKMKKQLLLDLFAHFFLMYIQQRSSLIKSGVIMKDKIYKPYHEPQMEVSQDITMNSDMDIVSFGQNNIDPVAFGLNNVKKVVISEKDAGDIIEFNIGKEDIKVKAKQPQEKTVVAKSQVAFEEKEEEKAVPSQIATTNLDVQQPVDMIEKNEQVNELSDNGVFSNLFSSVIRKKKRVHRFFSGFDYTSDMAEENDVGKYKSVEFKKEIEKER